MYTDNLLKALEANGVEPYYRLGVTIENAAFKVRAIDATHDFTEIPCPESIGKDTVLLFER